MARFNIGIKKIIVYMSIGVYRETILSGPGHGQTGGLVDTIIIPTRCCEACLGWDKSLSCEDLYPVIGQKTLIMFLQNSTNV